MVIVPAAIALMGRSAWWLPRWLSWLPAVDVEGTALERRVPDDARDIEEHVHAA
jgi:putative drug exporter of the RND superfamily